MPDPGVRDTEKRDKWLTPEEVFSPEAVAAAWDAAKDRGARDSGGDDSSLISPVGRQPDAPFKIGDGDDSGKWRLGTGEVFDPAAAADAWEQAERPESGNGFLDALKSGISKVGDLFLAGDDNNGVDLLNDLSGGRLFESESDVGSAMGSAMGAAVSATSRHQARRSGPATPTSEPTSEPTGSAFDVIIDAVKERAADLYGNSTMAAAMQQAHTAYQSGVAGIDRSIREENDQALRLILEGEKQRFQQRYQLFLLQAAAKDKASEDERLMSTIRLMQVTGEFDQLLRENGVAGAPEVDVDALDFARQDSSFRNFRVQEMYSSLGELESAFEGQTGQESGLAIVRNGITDFMYGDLDALAKSLQDLRDDLDNRVLDGDMDKGSADALYQSVSEWARQTSQEEYVAARQFVGGGYG